MCIPPRWVDYNLAISVPYSLRTPHQQKVIKKGIQEKENKKDATPYFVAMEIGRTVESLLDVST
jgi:hypothetical protein